MRNRRNGGSAFALIFFISCLNQRGAETETSHGIRRCLPSAFKRFTL